LYSLGKGAFGEVYLVYAPKTRKFNAVKKFNDIDNFEKEKNRIKDIFPHIVNKLDDNI
jgi:serine/threonine protein kinase